MTAVCLYFKVHQPCRLKKYLPGDVGVSHCYEDVDADEATISRAADRCYLPANAILYRLARQNRNLHFNFSFSAIVLEMMARYRPDALRSFQQLTSTGNVEILGEACCHSLSALHSATEFEEQVRRHTELVGSIFKQRPSVFRNTELIHNNQLAKRVAGLGFKGLLCEGVKKLLRDRSPNHVYLAPGVDDFRLLLRNARLSDDIAFRFDDVRWSEYPLTAETFAKWLHAHPAGTEVINLFMDYETFGIHKTRESGVFEFLEALPVNVTAAPDFYFSTASSVIERSAPTDTYDVPKTISWEDMSEETNARTENVMQHNTLKKIYSLERMVKESGCDKFLTTWRRLQSADHFYYMDTKTRRGSHNYESPFDSAEDAFSTYTNIITDFEISLIRHGLTRSKQRSSRRSVAATLF